MNIAARFPVKNYPPLFVGIILLHCLLLSISFFEFGRSWQQFLVITALLLSVYFSHKQYLKISQAPDDLCWNGDSWLMFRNERLKVVFYLELQQSSWISRHLCLLHFTSGGDKFSWLFSRGELQERMYSHLVYLVKQDLKASSKDQQTIA